MKNSKKKSKFYQKIQLAICLKINYALYEKLSQISIWDRNGWMLPEISYSKIVKNTAEKKLLGKYVNKFENS